MLIQGTGGVAFSALQVARMLGARVLAITSSDEKASILRELGAKAIVNFRKVPDWDRGILDLTDDMGVDIAGEKTIVKSAALTCKGWDITIAGFTSGFGGSGPPIDIWKSRRASPFDSFYDFIFLTEIETLKSKPPAYRSYDRPQAAPG